MSTTHAFVLLLGLTAVACGPKERTISGPLKLGPEWTEIKPNPPLESSRVIQTIALGLPDSVTVKDEVFKLVAGDGTPIDVDVEVVDDGGEIFPHQMTMFGGSWAGFGVVEEKRPKEDPLPYYLPPGRRYPIVRLRSNPPLAVSNVRFVCSSPK